MFFQHRLICFMNELHTTFDSNALHECVVFQLIFMAIFMWFFSVLHQFWISMAIYDFVMVVTIKIAI